ncbi:MAG: PKD domain-containing protein, partial [Planctomycetota bacterium]
MIAEVSLPGTEKEYPWTLTVFNLVSQDQASGVITVVNDPPVANAGIDQSVKIRDVATLDGSGSSDPNEEPLTYQWSFISMPLGSAAVLDDPTSATPSFAADRAGEYAAQLIVSDGELNSDPDTVTVTVVNDPPVAVAGRDRSVKPGTEITLDGSGSFDPNGAPITYNWSFVSIPNDSAAVLDDPTSVAPSFTADVEGKYIAQLVVNDGFLNSAPDTVTILAEEDHIRPEVDVTVNPSTANVGEQVTITVDATDNVGVIASKTLTVNSVAVALDASGQATYTSNTAGVFTAVGTARDEKGNEGYDSEEFRFRAADDGTDPIADITSPDDNSEVSTPTDIVGTASDDNLVLYKLEYSAKDKNDFITFASGTSSVTNGILGKLDPTMMRNGLYDVKLTAEDAGGRTASVTRTYQIQGQMKVGNFTISFNDLTIPVAGIPITITRTYDSRNRTKGDFGAGWTLDLSDIEVSESGAMGESWQLAQAGDLIPSCGLQETEPHYVTVTYPDDRVDRFNMAFSPASWSFCPPLKETTVYFTAAPDTFSRLAALADNTLLVMGSAGGPATLQDYDFDLYDPNRYQLTTADGIVYTIDQNTGLEGIRDASGNTITFGPNGIIHSAGKSVAFTRDAQGRITTITDPMGNVIQYEYDYYGDLVRVTDQEGSVTRFTYNSNHGLLDIIDARGIRGIRNEYDDEGRIIAHVDADGNRIEYTHNVGTRQEVVKDRLGNNTVYEYDDDGNIVQVSDSLGNVIQRTYDAQGNKLSETDPLGNTTAYTYDAKGNMLSEADPLGNATTYTYNSNGKILTIINPNGNVITNIYDANGNLVSTTDPLGNVTTNIYDAQGNLTSTTDPLGNVTTHIYDAVGNRISTTDPFGNATTYTYDANGNKLSETNAAGGTTKRYVYDQQSRLVQTIDPYNNTTNTEYNAIGRESATVDKLGTRTEYEYDAYNNLTRVIHPNGTEESFTYDAEGRRLTSTDRGGRATSYEYDNLGRLVKTIFPDGTFTQTEHDAAGHVLRTTDERSNATQYAYDAAGRRTSITDALGNITTFEYDSNDNQVRMTDANGNVIQYEYDANNQLTQTTYPDGTSTSSTYDALGRRISETDQAGSTTQFQYDALGRLVKVIDALGNETSYAYDEVGNLISQTDANGNTTRFEYDNLGRRTKRTLPMGMEERFVYDANGNIISQTDFNGNTITFEYDIDNRLIKNDLPDGTSETYTYTATGKRQTVTDSRGITSYEYDQRDRLTRRVDPDGRSISYTYGEAGNRTSVA